MDKLSGFGESKCQLEVIFLGKCVFMVSNSILYNANASLNQICSFIYFRKCTHLTNRRLIAEEATGIP